MSHNSTITTRQIAQYLAKSTKTVAATLKRRGVSGTKSGRDNWYLTADVLEVYPELSDHLPQPTTHPPQPEPDTQTGHIELIDHTQQATSTATDHPQLALLRLEVRHLTDTNRDLREQIEWLKNHIREQADRQTAEVAVLRADHLREVKDIKERDSHEKQLYLQLTESAAVARDYYLKSLLNNQEIKT